MTSSQKVRSITVALSILTLTLGTAYPQRSQAIVGAMVPAGAGIPLMIAGGVLFGGGFFGMTGSAISGLGCIFGCSPQKVRANRIALYTSIASMGLGFLLLDESGQVDLIPLTTTAAQSLLITEEERLAYNDEIEEIRVMGEDLGLWMNGLSPQNAQENRLQLQIRFAQVQEQLSPPASRALIQVLRHPAR